MSKWLHGRTTWFLYGFGAVQKKLWTGCAGFNLWMGFLIFIVFISFQPVQLSFSCTGGTFCNRRKFLKTEFFCVFRENSQILVYWFRKIGANFEDRLPIFVGINKKNKLEKFDLERFATDREKTGSQAHTTPLNLIS